MAIPAGTVWEIRSTATVGNLNGGGFNPANTGNAGGPGTDLSQSDTPSYTFTNLVGASANTATPTVTSASHTFVGADCGNIIHITAGTNWTAGWYEIVSTSAGAATLDRACGTVAAPTGGTFAVGGALSLGVVSSATGRSDANFFITPTAGNTVWVKAGSYTMGTGVNLPWNASTNTATILFLGYQITRNDNPVGNNRPILTSNSGQFQVSTQGVVKNLIFQGGIATLVSSVAGSATFYNCKFYQNSLTPSRIAITSNEDVFIDCEITAPFGYGLSGSGNANFYGCYIHDCTVGIRNTGSANLIQIRNCVFQTNITHYTATITTARDQSIIGNTFYGAQAPLGTGILLNGGGATRIMNNIFYGLSTAVSNTVVSNGFNDINNYFNNTIDRTNFPVETTAFASNPNFTNVTNLTGAAGVISSATLTDAVQDFSGVTDNVDYCYIASGTGISPLGSYLIVSHTTNSVTLTSAPGGSGTDINYTVVLGKNFGVGTSMKALGTPGTYGNSTSYLDLGSVQRKEDYPAITDVRTGTVYSNTALTGTCAVPAAAYVVSGIAVDNTTGSLTVLPTASQNAIAVWDELTAGHATSGSYGVLMHALLTLAQFLGLK